MNGFKYKKENEIKKRDYSILIKSYKSNNELEREPENSNGCLVTDAATVSIRLTAGSRGEFGVSEIFILMSE